MTRTAQSEWVVGSPGPRLAPLIDSYIGYRLSGSAPGIHRGLPSHNMTFIVSVAAPIDVVAQTDPSQSPHSYSTIVAGLHSSPALIAHQGYQEGVAVVLSPLGSRALFGMPARALWNTSAELADVIGTTGHELWERVQHARGWNRRMAVIDEVLSELASDSAAVPADVSYAWESLVASVGVESVAQIASNVGWSRQHLTRRFRDEFGPSPKTVARVVRFGRAVRMIESADGNVSFAEVAVSCGYYDQAHMTGDFVDIAGCTPGELHAGEDVPKFQDIAEPTG